MKKKIALLLALIMVFSLCACSAGSVGYNKQIVDWNYKYNTAVIFLPDGTMKTCVVASWNDWEDSDMIQIVDDKGIVYYTHASNVILEYIP